MANPVLGGSGSAADPQPSGGVFVEINSSSRPVRIDRVLDRGMTVPVCVSPCRQVLPRNGVYVITGDGVLSTSPFALPVDRDRVVLDVHPAPSSASTIGAVAAGGGGLSILAGFVFVMANFGNGLSWHSEEKHEKGPGEEVVGIMIVGGLMVGLAGICLLLGNKTKVTSSTGAHFSETPAPKRSRFALTARGLEF